jgi:hypothetical protein
MVTAKDPVLLRCDRKLHAVMMKPSNIIEIHCRRCSAQGQKVYHRWDTVSGKRMRDRVE